MTVPAIFSDGLRASGSGLESLIFSGCFFLLCRTALSVRGSCFGYCRLRIPARDAGGKVGYSSRSMVMFGGLSLLLLLLVLLLLLQV